MVYYMKVERRFNEHIMAFPTELTLNRDTDYRLLLLLGRAGDVLSKVRKLELARYGVSPVEALALFVLEDMGNGATPAEVSRRMLRQHNTVTALLCRMEKKGLLTRERDSDGSSKWRISMTPKGEDVCRQAISLSSVHGALSGIPESQKLELESYLKTICDNAQMQIVRVAIGD